MTEFPRVPRISDGPVLKSGAERLALEAQGVWEQADRENRALSGDERGYVQELLEKAKSLKEVEDLGRQLGVGFTTAGTGGGVRATSLGEAFVNSEGYKSIRSGRPQQWTTGPVEVGLSQKGTLLEGSGSPGSGSGGGLIPVPQVVPGFVDKLFAPLVLENLLLSGVATGNTVRYAVQGTATSGAAGVAEGGTKPESTLGFSTVDEPIKKIATSITIADELLEDAPAVQQLINGQLSQFVRIEAERQILRGTSGGNEVQGIITSRGVPVYAAGTAVGNRAVQIFKAMNGMRGSAFVEPEWVVMHPTDWEAIRLLTDTAGQYLAGGPVQGPYGNGSNYSASGQLTGATDMLWNKPVYLSPVIGAGTALIGNSASAQVWSKGGPSCEATNSHGSNFGRSCRFVGEVQCGRAMTMPVQHR
jgi:HK97 family phage major capsid protein